jgi:hypothetical protein
MVANRTRAWVLPLCIFALATGALFIGGLAASQRYCGPGTGQTVANPAGERTGQGGAGRLQARARTAGAGLPHGMVVRARGKRAG